MGREYGILWRSFSNYCWSCSRWSVYDSRAAACGTLSQATCQMLIGDNDQIAATAMHLNSVEWATDKEQSTEDFLVWVKQNTLKGYVVIIGIYQNYYEFYDDSSPLAGDPDYDHIVPVLGIRSNHPLNDTNTYYNDDEIIFSDNGLYGDSSNPPYIFSYPFQYFQNSRKNANSKNGNIYSLPNSGSNYGIFINSIFDENHETFPIRIDTNINYESPEIKDGSSIRPKPMKLTLTVTVSSLTMNTYYACYRYNNLVNIPNSDFNSFPSKAIGTYFFQANATSYSWKINILSDEVVAFRCVKAKKRRRHWHLRHSIDRKNISFHVNQ